MTNSAAATTISNLAQHAGYNLSAHEIEAAITDIVLLVRWLHLEIPVWVNGWKSIGGFNGLKSFITTGKTQT